MKDAIYRPLLPTARSQHEFDGPFATHGLPATIVVDLGPDFMGTAIRECLTAIGICGTAFAPGKPHLKSIVERQRRTI